VRLPETEDARAARRDLPEPVGMDAQRNRLSDASQSMMDENTRSWPSYQDGNRGWLRIKDGAGKIVIGEDAPLHLHPGSIANRCPSVSPLGVGVLAVLPFAELYSFLLGEVGSSLGVERGPLGLTPLKTYEHLISP